MRRTDGSTADAVLLRPATVQDRPAMALVQRRARLAAPLPDLTVARATAGLAAGWEGDELWVAVVAGTVVGYARFVRPGGERVGWLDDLYVLPEHAGHGVGTALLDLVKATLPDGFGLWAFASNLPARAFYRARGLREIEHVPARESPHGQPEVRLVWSTSLAGA